MASEGPFWPEAFCGPTQRLSLLWAGGGPRRVGCWSWWSGRCRRVPRSLASSRQGASPCQGRSAKSWCAERARGRWRAGWSTSEAASLLQGVSEAAITCHQQGNSSPEPSVTNRDAPRGSALPGPSHAVRRQRARSPLTQQAAGQDPAAGSSSREQRCRRYHPKLLPCHAAGSRSLA